MLRGIVTILRKVGRGSQAWWISVQSLCVLILVQSLTMCVTLGKSRDLSGPQLALLCPMGSQKVIVIIKWINIHAGHTKCCRRVSFIVIIKETWKRYSF